MHETIEIVAGTALTLIESLDLDRERAVGAAVEAAAHRLTLEHGPLTDEQLWLVDYEIRTLLEVTT